MKLLEKLFGVNPDKIKELETNLFIIQEKITALEKTQDLLLNEMKNLRKDLTDKASKETLRQIERELSEVGNLIQLLSVYVLHEKEAVEGPSINSEVESLENIILNLIKSGYDTPSSLIHKVNVGTGKLYEVLNHLIAKKKLRKIKKGKRVYYVVVED